MLKSYLLVALRKLSREKAYVLINILSLALGMASFFILALYLRSELTYDQHHVNHQRIYRVTTWFHPYADPEPDHFALTPAGLGPLLVKDFPQLGRQARLRLSTQNVLSHAEKTRQWERVYLADPTVFDVFTHRILYGDPQQAFDNPYSIAISESMANFYFGEGNPIGKTIDSGAFSYAVRLVFEDIPENSHLRYDALLPMAMMDVFSPGFSSGYANSFSVVNVFTYVMVPEEFAPVQFDAISAKFVDTYMAEGAKQNKERVEVRWQPLAGIHFGEKLAADLPIGNVFYVYGFAAVALFVLVVACINYVNLATARATKRAKEVGMRKVLGADRWQLMAQFLGESLTFSALALGIAICATYLALTITPLGSLMGRESLVADLASPSFLFGMLAVAILVGVLAGLYPAAYLSSISPLVALTHVRRSWATGVSLRNALVFVQLAVSIAVIACTLLMLEQMRYIHDKPLGFEKENRLLVTLRGYDVVKNVQVIKSELQRQRNVVDVTTFSKIPGTGAWINLAPTETNAGVMEPVVMHRVAVGRNFLDAMKLSLVEGRAFSEDIATDAREAVIVNEAFVEKMGWENPIGKRMQWGRATARVIGVVQDFHYDSLHNEVGPMMIHPLSEEIGAMPESQRALASTSLIIVLSGMDIQATLNAVEAVLARFDPRFNFEAVFLEDRLADLYRTESRLMKLTGTFAGVCILISIMGIFGLAAFTTEQRTKEIGTRKVLGASHLQIVALLSRPLLWLVLLAAVPASYAGYRAMQAWMEQFVYHTSISGLTFLLSALIVCVIALATVVVQSLRVARSNPVDALRYE